MKMTAETMAAKLAEISDLPLVAVILYGSAASGDHAGAQSDLNLLIVLERLGRTELDKLSEPTRQWIRAGQPPPMMFTRDRLVRSADVFPIELQDLKETARILHGEDPLKNVTIQPEHLRIEVEHEMKGKLAYLQSEYLRTGGRDRPLRALMSESLSTFLVLARALLRFFDPQIPPRKMEALHALCTHVDVDAEAFEQVQAVKERRSTPRGEILRAMFDRYLSAIEQLAVTADTKLDPHGGARLAGETERKERTST